jgi:hypothetical protein
MHKAKLHKIILVSCLAALTSLNRFSEAVFSVGPVDLNTVYSGIFQPENILIHVSQNMFNFITSTLCWLLVLPFYRDPNNNNMGGGRRRRKRRSYAKRNMIEVDAAEDDESRNQAFDNAEYIAQVLRAAADSVLGFQR